MYLRLRVANEQIDRIRKYITTTPEKIAQIIPEWKNCEPLPEQEFEDMINLAWMVQAYIENELASVLRFSSIQAKYFPRTFEVLERIDIAQVNKLTNYDKIRISSIARDESIEAIKHESPRILKAAYERKKAVSRLYDEIMGQSEYWDQKHMPLFAIQSSDESTPEHPSLMTEISGSHVLPGGAILGKHALNIAIANRVFDNYLRHLLSDFFSEEDVLLGRFNNWYGMR